MANLNKTKLDAAQCVVGAYDGVEEANRVIIAAATEFAIELSASDGDSVASYSAKSIPVVSAAQTPATALNAVLATMTDVSSYSKIAVYSEALAGVTVAGQAQLQASPDGVLWANLGTAVASPAAPGTAVSSVSEFVAKQLRLVSTVAPTGGNVVYTILLGS
jgi:hypothetical protein